MAGLERRKLARQRLGFLQECGDLVLARPNFLEPLARHDSLWRAVTHPAVLGPDMNTVAAERGKQGFNHQMIPSSKLASASAAIGAVAAQSRSPARSASSPSVAVSNIALSGKVISRSFCTRAIARVAESESPPSAKKLSLMETRSSLSTSRQIAASASSVALRGATISPPPCQSGAGSALRSSLPLADSGR